MSRTKLWLRYALVLVTFPFAYVADRARGFDPPSSLRVGLAWARGEHEFGIPTQPPRGRPKPKETSDDH